MRDDKSCKDPDLFLIDCINVRNKHSLIIFEKNPMRTFITCLFSLFTLMLHAQEYRYGTKQQSKYKKKAPVKIKIKSAQICLSYINSFKSDQLDCSITDPDGKASGVPNPECNIRDMFFRVPDGQDYTSNWYIYKGYDNDTRSVCFILASEQNEMFTTYRYYKGKVYCPKICGLVNGSLQRMDLTDVMRHDADTCLEEIDTYENALPYIGRQVPELYNRIQIPYKVLQWMRNYEAVYFRIFLGQVFNGYV